MFGSSINNPIPAVQIINETVINPTISFLCSLKNSITVPLIISYYKKIIWAICKKITADIILPEFFLSLRSINCILSYSKYDYNSVIARAIARGNPAFCKLILFNLFLFDFIFFFPYFGGKSCLLLFFLLFAG